MNLREVKALKVGDKFRRPSRNGHDEGFRIYTVREITSGHIDLIDHHGYQQRILINLTWRNSGCAAWMQTAVKES